jgi:4-amino-4-deoxy-L-arabinose transferase-like glycosyltransferase
MANKTPGSFLEENKEILLLFLIMAFALNFRMMLLGLHRLHADECLYAAHGIRIVTHGDLGLNGGLGVDKPPVMFYSIALSFLINGISENAARLPNIIYSLIAVFYIYKLALILYKNGAMALLSAFFAAFSVTFTLFSATAFLDISMAAFFILSLYMAAIGRFKASAVFYALSICSKPMTLFLLPLYALFLVLEDGYPQVLSRAKEILKGFLYVLAPLVLWDGLIATPRWGLFKYFRTEQPEVMNLSNDIAGRFNVWLGYSEHILNNYAFFFIAVAGLLALAAWGIAAKKSGSNLKNDSFFLVSIFYTYLLITLVRFRQYDRYIIVLVPFLPAALARVVYEFVSIFRNSKARAAVLAGILAFYMHYMCVLPGSGLKFGALYDGSDGFDRVASYIKHNSGQGTQLIYYGDALSWYGFFYLPDEKFYRLISVFNKEELERALAYFNGRNLIVIDSQARKPEEIDYLKKNFSLAYSADDGRNGREKYLVFENVKKTP